MEDRESQQNRFDVALASDLCVDLILRGNVRPKFHQQEQLVDNYALELGGSANIFACQMAKLGARIAVLGCIGTDVFGEYVLEQLNQAGVDTGLVRTDSQVSTGLGVALAEGTDRAILTILGGIAEVFPENLPLQPELLCRHWHVASPFLLCGLRSAWIHFLPHAKSAGVTVSLDTNWDPDERWDGIVELLPSVDVFFPNEAEAIALTGERDTREAARRLAQSGCLVVVKCGADGVVAASKEGEWALGPSEMAEKPSIVVDTIGAGDNFDAGFLWAWLQGQDVYQCISLGHSCAVASLGEAGGIRGQRTRMSKGREKQ
jgi:sugar/nucleoside kinase (ribokinase family)